MPETRNGKVALVNTVPVPTEVIVNSHRIIFDYKNLVALALVDPEDVGAVLDITRECCGGRHRRRFQYATEGQMKIWEGTYRK